MQSRRSILSDRLNEDRPIHCFKSNITDPMIPELLGRCGLDCLWLDCEHFPTGTETMFKLVQACRAGDIDSVVRVPNHEFLLAAKMLDLGADAIMYPRSRGAEEVTELVRWLRFPPVGRRGADTGVTAAGFGRLSIPQLFESAHRQTSILVQIETPEALESVDAIASVKGIDILFIGPGDLAIELGVPCDPSHPTFARAIRRVADAAAKHGIHWGMPALSLDHGQQLLAMGAQFIAYASDTGLLGREVAAIREKFLQMGVPFRDS